MKDNRLLISRLYLCRIPDRPLTLWMIFLAYIVYVPVRCNLLYIVCYLELLLYKYCVAPVNPLIHSTQQPKTVCYTTTSWCWCSNPETVLMSDYEIAAIFQMQHMKTLLLLYYVVSLFRWQLPSHNLMCQPTSSGIHILWPSLHSCTFLGFRKPSVLPSRKYEIGASFRHLEQCEHPLEQPHFLADWSADLLVPIPLTPPPLLILSRSCTMRMTLPRPRPASSSRALLPRPRLAHPARTRARPRPRPRPARRLPPQQQQGRHQDRGLRGRRRHLHLLTPPLTWGQPLQHLVCVHAVLFDGPRDYFPFCRHVLVHLPQQRVYFCVWLHAS